MMRLVYAAVAAGVSVCAELLLRGWLGPTALPVAVALGLLAGFALKRRPTTPRQAAFVLLIALGGAAGTGLGQWLTGTVGR
jgi:hypothetical protein